jgi:hypothetical protein
LSADDGKDQITTEALRHREMKAEVTKQKRGGGSFFCPLVSDFLCVSVFKSLIDKDETTTEALATQRNSSIKRPQV